MTSRDADVVAGWRYPGEYAFYDFDADPDDLAELMDPAEWGDRYFAADDTMGELVGFFVFKRVNKQVELGLGLRPDLAGMGLGQSFVEAGVRYATDELAAEEIRLNVAAFNERAIMVYRRAGFEFVRRYQHETNGGVHEFIEMRKGSL